MSWTVFVIHVNLWVGRIYIALKIISGTICSGCHFRFFSSVSIFIIRETTLEMERSRTSSIPPISFVTFFIFYFFIFIKIYFVTGLVDESEKIGQVADYPFGSILKGDKVLTSSHVCCWVLTLMYNVFAVKAHLLVYNSFVEDIFILNDCHAMKHRCISRFGFKCGCRCGTWQFLKKVEFRCIN